MAKLIAGVHAAWPMMAPLDMTMRARLAAWRYRRWTIRGRLAAWRYRWQLYRRVRWTDPTVNEVELAVIGAAFLLAIMAVLIIMAGRG